MQHMFMQIKQFAQQLKAKRQSPKIHAHVYHVQVDPDIQTFTMHLHFLNEEGDELDAGTPPLPVIKNGYGEIDERQFKGYILHLFKELQQSENDYFTHPTYVSFEDELMNHHVQSLIE